MSHIRDNPTVRDKVVENIEQFVDADVKAKDIWKTLFTPADKEKLEGQHITKEGFSNWYKKLTFDIRKKREDNENQNPPGLFQQVRNDATTFIIILTLDKAIQRIQQLQQTTTATQFNEQLNNLLQLVTLARAHTSTIDSQPAADPVGEDEKSNIRTNSGDKDDVTNSGGKDDVVVHGDDDNDDVPAVDDDNDDVPAVDVPHVDDVSVSVPSVPTPVGTNIRGQEISEDVVRGWYNSQKRCLMQQDDPNIQQTWLQVPSPKNPTIYQYRHATSFDIVCTAIPSQAGIFVLPWPRKEGGHDDPAPSVPANDESSSSGEEVDEEDDEWVSNNNGRNSTFTLDTLDDDDSSADDEKENHDPQYWSFPTAQEEAVQEQQQQQVLPSHDDDRFRSFDR